MRCLLLSKLSFLFVFIFLPLKVSGFSITPMFSDMQPNGSGARTTITVTSSSPRPMPVQTNVTELILDANGKVSSVPNNKDFIIFPPQAVIQPHGKQTFRVQWRGQPNLPQAKTYEIAISQVLAKDNRPDDNKENTSLKVQLALGFGAIVSMNAASGQPSPAVQASRLIRNWLGKPALETIINNRSNQNFLLVQADNTVTLYGNNNRSIWSHTYTPDEMRRNFGLGMVQPYKSRRMQIPLPNLPDHIARQARSAKLEIRPSAQ